MSWLTEVLDPATMSESDLRAELRHDLHVYDRLHHSLSKAGMARRIEALVEELDHRVASTTDALGASPDSLPGPAPVRLGGGQGEGLEASVPDAPDGGVEA